jgi:hypothetical protein
MNDLGQRADRLQSIQEITALKHRYWRYNDTGLLGDRIAPLFTEDGIWSNAELGHYAGREAIRTFFNGASAALPFCAHVGMNPLIDIVGNDAKAKWRALLPATFVDNGARKSHLILIDYADEFQRIGGCWYIRSLDILFNFNIGFGAAWAGTERIRAAG